MNRVSLRRPAPADATILRDILALRDAQRVRAAIATEFGFVPSLAYCEALIKFVDTMTGKGPEGGPPLDEIRVLCDWCIGKDEEPHPEGSRRAWLARMTGKGQQGDEPGE